MGPEGRHLYQASIWVRRPDSKRFGMQVTQGSPRLLRNITRLENGISCYPYRYFPLLSSSHYLLYIYSNKGSKINLLVCDLEVIIVGEIAAFLQKPPKLISDTVDFRGEKGVGKFIRTAVERRRTLGAVNQFPVDLINYCDLWNGDLQNL